MDSLPLPWSSPSWQVKISTSFSASWTRRLTRITALRTLCHSPMYQPVYPYSQLR